MSVVTMVGKTPEQKVRLAFQKASVKRQPMQTEIDYPCYAKITLPSGEHHVAFVNPEAMGPRAYFWDTAAAGLPVLDDWRVDILGHAYTYMSMLNDAVAGPWSAVLAYCEKRGMEMPAVKLAGAVYEATQVDWRSEDALASAITTANNRYARFLSANSQA